jgi:hypothetical protein
MQQHLQSPAPTRRHAEWKLQWSATQGKVTTISELDDGSSVATTNAVTPINLIISADWALLSLGNPGVGRLNNFASRALHETTILGISINERYYTQAAVYAYWMGCSQGVRQGLMTAQRYPDSYNGIMVIPLAVDWIALGSSSHARTRLLPATLRSQSFHECCSRCLRWARWYSRWRCQLPGVSIQPLCFGRAIRLQWHQHRIYRKRSQHDGKPHGTPPRSADREFQWYGYSIIQTLTYRLKSLAPSGRRPRTAQPHFLSRLAKIRSSPGSRISAVKNTQPWRNKVSNVMTPS